MFGNNPFTSGATQETVQEKTTTEMKDMVCKECGDKFGKPTNEKCMYDSKDPSGKNWMESKSVKESTVFMIPEEIPATERTAFHGAAAAAHKAGKKSFSFAGKTHPVTMKKSTADAIADQKEGYYKDMEIKKQDKEMGAKPVIGKKKKGETASMNPKLDSGKQKGAEMEQKESTIRSKLRAVLEAENHSPNKDKAEKPEDALKGAGAKKMKDDNADDGRYHDMEKQSHDDASKAGRAGPSMKARPNDNKGGDKKIINPPADETKKGQAPAVKTESYDSMNGLKAAYASMYEADKAYPKSGSEREKKQSNNDAQSWPHPVKKHSAVKSNKKLNSLFDKHEKQFDHHVDREEHHMNETDDERKIAHHGISVSNHNAALFHINHAAHTIAKHGENHPKSQARLKNAMRVSKLANTGPSKAQVDRHLDS